MSTKLRLNSYLGAILVVALCTLIAGLIFPYFDAANLSMIYLAGVVIAALKVNPKSVRTYDKQF